MIPLSDEMRVRDYGYVSGCRNVGWLVGYVAEIDRDENMFMLTRQMLHPDREEMAENVAKIPLYFEGNDRVPDDLKVGQEVKVIVRIRSGVPEDQEVDLRRIRHVHLIAKGISRPTLLDMQPTESFKKMNEDEVTEVFDTESRLSRSTNDIQLAGFIDSRPLLIRGESVSQDRLIFVLRQGAGNKHAIPVELFGKKAAQYRNLVEVGRPVYVTGYTIPATVNVATDETDEDGNPIIERVPTAVVRCRDLRKAFKGEDILFDQVPEWVKEIRLRYLEEVKRSKDRLASAQKAVAEQSEQPLTTDAGTSNEDDDSDF